MFAGLVVPIINGRQQLISKNLQLKM